MSSSTVLAEGDSESSVHLRNVADTSTKPPMANAVAAAIVTTVAMTTGRAAHPIAFGSGRSSSSIPVGKGGFDLVQVLTAMVGANGIQWAVGVDLCNELGWQRRDELVRLL